MIDHLTHRHFSPPTPFGGRPAASGTHSYWRPEATPPPITKLAEIGGFPQPTREGVMKNARH